MPKNRLTFSEQFDNAAWVKTNLVVAGGDVNTTATLDPVGTNTAEKLVETAISGVHDLTQSGIPVVSGGVYTASVYFKQAERAFVNLYMANSGAWGGTPQVRFSLGAGTVASATGGATGAIASVGNGWYRCAVTATATASLNAGVGLNLHTGATNNYLGVVGSGLYAWGAQLELSGFMTYYLNPLSPEPRRKKLLMVRPGALRRSFSQRRRLRGF